MPLQSLGMIMSSSSNCLLREGIEGKHVAYPVVVVVEGAWALWAAKR